MVKQHKSPEGQSPEERQAEAEWRQVDAGIRKAIRYPTSGARCLIEFLEKVRDFMTANGGAPVSSDPAAPATIPSSLLALPDLVRELVRRVGALEEGVAKPAEIRNPFSEPKSDPAATVTTTTEDPPVKSTKATDKA